MCSVGEYATPMGTIMSLIRGDTAMSKHVFVPSSVDAIDPDNFPTAELAPKRAKQHGSIKHEMVQLQRWMEELAVGKTIHRRGRELQIVDDVLIIKMERHRIQQVVSELLRD